MGAHRSDLADAIEAIRIVDTHEHLRYEGDWVEGGPDVLQALFELYAHHDLVTAGADPDAVARLLDASAGGIAERFAGVLPAWEASQHTGYGEAVRITARELLGLDELTPAGLEEAQPRLEALQRPGRRLQLLRDTAGIDHVQIDDFRWACPPDPSGPDFFLYDLSWMSFCTGAVEAEAILTETGIDVRGTGDLRDAMATLFARHAPCAIAVKSQHAYERTLRWEERSDAEAARALTAVLAGHASESERLVLGDWCLARGVELAVEHGLPFKIHTGTYGGNGRMPVERIRPGHLCGVLARYPEARFVLMHAGFPYGGELIAVAKHYPNAWVDLCWAWAVDPSGTEGFVRRFLHAVPASRLFAFGGDAYWPTASVAYAMQARRRLARALAAEVGDGELTGAQAAAVARRLLRENQLACFDVERAQRAARAAVAG